MTSYPRSAGLTQVPKRCKQQYKQQQDSLPLTIPTTAPHPYDAGPDLASRREGGGEVG